MPFWNSAKIQTYHHIKSLTSAGCPHTSSEKFPFLQMSGNVTFNISSVLVIVHFWILWILGSGFYIMTLLNSVSQRWEKTLKALEFRNSLLFRVKEGQDRLTSDAVTLFSHSSHCSRCSSCNEKRSMKECKLQGVSIYSCNYRGGVTQTLRLGCSTLSLSIKYRGIWDLLVISVLRQKLVFEKFRESRESTEIFYLFLYWD